MKPSERQLRKWQNSIKVRVSKRLLVIVGSVGEGRSLLLDGRWMVSVLSVRHCLCWMVILLIRGTIVDRSFRNTTQHSDQLFTIDNDPVRHLRGWGLVRMRSVHAKIRAAVPGIQWPVTVLP